MRENFLIFVMLFSVCAGRSLLCLRNFRYICKIWDEITMGALKFLLFFVIFLFISIIFNFYLLVASSLAKASYKILRSQLVQILYLFFFSLHKLIICFYPQKN